MRKHATHVSVFPPFADIDFEGFFSPSESPISAKQLFNHFSTSQDFSSTVFINNSAEEKNMKKSLLLALVFMCFTNISAQEMPSFSPEIKRVAVF